MMHHCQDCKFWIHAACDAPLDDAECVRVQSYGDATIVDGQLFTKKEFGCTQWEQKEKR